MKFKKYTQSYFLIKKNSTYGYSMGERAKAAVFNSTIAILGLYAAWNPKIPSNDEI